MAGNEPDEDSTPQHDEDQPPPSEREDGEGAEDGDELETAFGHTVVEGSRRLERPLAPLLATGFVGGVDVSIGVFALLTVLHVTDNKTLASLAFSIGFVALTLARSELFTENFLVPIAATVARRHPPYLVLRLWAGTATTNLVGGWVVAGIVASGFPNVHSSAVELGQHFVDIGIGWRSFSTAMLGGVIITLMTWMIEGTTSQGARIVAAVVAGFLLTVGEINHCIVASLEMFVALIAGAPYGYLDWWWIFVWAALGNVVGGVLLVTMLRLIQVGTEPIRRERANTRTAGPGVLQRSGRD